VLEGIPTISSRRLERSMAPPGASQTTAEAQPYPVAA
jgi:hypothetical protein